MSLAWLKVTGGDPARLNVDGGAISLGHPLGATGTKLMSTLVHALRQRGARFGLQTVREAGGMANVTIVERFDELGKEAMNLQDISAVVTGGASGLGAATARALAVAGARVSLFDLNWAKVERLAGDIDGFFSELDVSDDASVAAGFESARAVLGQERILVNCAGIGGLPAKTAA